MDSIQAKKIIETLYKNIDGFKISADAQLQRDYQYIGFEYGEATIETFTKMLSIVQPKKNEVFYDLESGIIFYKLHHESQF